ncbi:carboxypeptidase-like regulatory domain-containing protein [Pedobacter sp. JCM 36344]|uniref:carboxypeptidase-like regulatory domain-containing protein n=1 Tax=Pedobacter sp. JCM 36344 TaxID=3374280 RepID=UPI00397E6912
MNNDWLNIDVLEDYLDGKLDAKTMNRVEREALEDPFVAEALTGLSASPKRSLESISLLQKQLRDRINQHQIIKKQSVITWQRLSIGSAAAVLFITVGIVYWMNQVNYDKALNSSKKVEVSIAPKKDQDSGLSKAVMREVFSLPKEEAIAQTRKAKVVLSAPDATASQSSVAVPKQTDVEEKIASRRASAIFSSAVVMKTSQRSDIVSGKVVDEATGSPMIGAYVSARDSKGLLKVVASVDANGLFSFKKDDSIVDSTIIISSVSYDTQVLRIKSNQPLTIALKETSNILNEEVVIRGYVNRTKEQTTGSSYIVSGKEVVDVPVGNVEQLLQGKVAGLNIQNNSGAPSKSHPIEGWDHYFMYLNNNNKFKGQPRVGKSVELSFIIDTAGLAQNIKVVSGISSKYDKEAIRLMKEGPRWLQPQLANAKISFRIDF